MTEPLAKLQVLRGGRVWSKQNAKSRSDENEKVIWSNHVWRDRPSKCSTALVKLGGRAWLQASSRASRQVKWRKRTTEKLAIHLRILIFFFHLLLTIGMESWMSYPCQPHCQPLFRLCFWYLISYAETSPVPFPTFLGRKNGKYLSRCQLGSRARIADRNIMVSLHSMSSRDRPCVGMNERNLPTYS